MSKLAALEKMLASGRDDALLRFSLGNACHQEGQLQAALIHLAKAVEINPRYSAAWKLYGKVLVELGRSDEAIAAFQRGIEIAEESGDVQAAKEMRVFLRRVESTKPEVS